MPRLTGASKSPVPTTLVLVRLRRLTFSDPVAAFGLFVVDANELDNSSATATQNGQLLTQAQIEARPFDTIDGIFRIVTERSPGVFEVLFDSGTFPAPAATVLFAGLIDDVNPFTNIILVNGSSGLDVNFADGFGYDDMIVKAARVPEAEFACTTLPYFKRTCIHPPSI